MATYYKGMVESGKVVIHWTWYIRDKLKIDFFAERNPFCIRVEVERLIFL